MILAVIKREWVLIVCWVVLIGLCATNLGMNLRDLHKETGYDRRVITRGLLMKEMVEILEQQPLTPEQRSRLEQKARDAELP